MDLGGASVEIAFLPSSSIEQDEYKSTEDLFGETYEIYSRSYLCLGHNEARRRFRAHLANQVSSVKSLLEELSHTFSY